jgi:hypothetical protein
LADRRETQGDGKRGIASDVTKLFVNVLPQSLFFAAVNQDAAAEEHRVSWDTTTFTGKSKAWRTGGKGDGGVVGAT